MITDLLISAPSIATELIERTSSTQRVQEIVRLSLAPAFLLAGIGAMMNVIVSRLTWIATRIERMEARADKDAGKDRIRQSQRDRREYKRLIRRRRLAQRAMILSTMAALIIAMVIALLFVSAFIRPQIGVAIAAAWIAAMLSLIAALLTFVLETMVAASGQKIDKEQGKTKQETM